MNARYHLFLGSLICLSLASGNAIAAPSSSRVLTPAEKSADMKGFEVLQVQGKDAELIHSVFGRYENLQTADEVIGLRSVICEQNDNCLVATSRPDIFEQDELVENENFDLTPFNGLTESEQAFMSPTLEHADKTEEMSHSSSLVYKIMSAASGKKVLNYRQNLINGFVESKTLRGEKIEIRCFHEFTTVKLPKKKFKKAAVEVVESYNCQIYSKVTKAIVP